MEPRYRLAVFQDGIWSPARYEGVFGQEERWLAAAPSGSPLELLIALLDAMTPPYRLELEVLEPEGLDAREGELFPVDTFDRDSLVTWLGQHAEALENDARLAVLVHGSQPGERIVYDEHNRLLLNGDQASFEGLLLANGLLPGDPSVPMPHSHHYLPQVTGALAALLG
jgi:hypothetical protein